MANHGAALDDVFHALSDPTRRAVVQRLGRGEATVSELARPFEMALPSFVKHLAVLENSRLISSRKLGRVRTCSLERENLAVVGHWLDEMRAQWASRYDNLDTLLSTMTGEDDA